MKQMSRFRNILAYVLVVAVLLWGLTVFTGAGRRDQGSYWLLYTFGAADDRHGGDARGSALS